MLKKDSGKISRRDFLKGVTAGAVSTSLTCLFPLGAFASEEAEKDWGEYSIENDGYGYLTANFPAEYPESYISVESDSIIAEKVEALLQTLTLDEKIELLSGDGGMTGGGGPFAGSDEYTDKSYGTGYWKGCARVGVPVIRMYDGPMGIRANSGLDTTRPANELSVASSFNTETAYNYGTIYAADGVANSGNMQLGIQTDLIRTLSTSRAKDMFGEDWYLEGTIAGAMGKGLEDNGVIACLKHIGGFSNLDEATMMENYLSAYEIIMKDDDSAHAVMTNYEASNGVMASEDRYILKTVLRDMWNWQGMVITDWGANYSFTVDDGVTMETPNAIYNTAEAIEEALSSGELTEEEIDQAVYYNLFALGKAGYLAMVQISRDGGVGTDEDAPAAIELTYKDSEERQSVLEQNNELAIQTAEEGTVLLKNEDTVLPLGADSGSVALIGLGSVHLVAGYHGECAFGWLPQLAISPYDALQEAMPDNTVSAYVAQDQVGEAIPAEYLYTDAEASENGVLISGTDGYGTAVEETADTIDFVTNSTDYRNAEDGTAFEYGDEGASLTFTTYLKAPETGVYTIKVEGIAATEISASVEIGGVEVALGAAGGAIASGFVATTSYVTTGTGLDIPVTTECYDPSFAEENSETEEENPFGGVSSYTKFSLEEGQVYKITVSANGKIDDAYDFLRGRKDMQVRLAWITPSQETENYDAAILAAASSDTVVLFAYSIDDLMIDETQSALLGEAIAAAKEAGNKVVLVLSTGLPVDIGEWVDDCDAVIETWLPGQGGGTVISDILTGAYNPSAKLCVTWPSDFSDDNGALNTEGRGGSKDGENYTSGTTEIKEGIYNGYKWYDSMGKADSVRWDFGYGLSYTEFSYELDSVELASDSEEYGVDVTVTVTNIGDMAGSEAVQLYIAAPENGLVENAIYSPNETAESFTYVMDENGETEYFPIIEGVQFAPIQLVGFAHTQILEPGDSETVTLHVSQRCLSYWDASLGEEEMHERENGTKDKWTVVEGIRTFYIAKSSDELTIQTEVEIESLNVVSAATIEVQQTAAAGQVFRARVTTAADVTGVELRDRNGEVIDPVDSAEEDLGDSLRFTLYLQVDETGTLELNVYTITEDGVAEEPDATAEVTIQ